MTNSTPPKLIGVHVTPEHIKANGIDTLTFSVTGEWKSIEWFSYFASLKKEAQETSLEVPGTIRTDNLPEGWSFRMKPSGTDGYEWLLNSNDYTLRIGKWATATTKPNVIVEIRAETLWRLGTEEACSMILTMLSDMGIDIAVAKPSRVDLCLDILLPESLWKRELIDYVVTRADERNTYMTKKNSISGFIFGKKHLMARLYDKPLEIKKKSQKYWMYDIWGIDEIPRHKVMVRVEYEIKRAILRQMRIKTMAELFEKQASLWVYCTKKWLKFQDNPGSYRMKRNDMEWWKVIQNGYEKAQGATPAIRERILKLDIDQLSRQAYGLLLSIAACHKELKREPMERIPFEEVLIIFITNLVAMGKNSTDMNDKIIERRYKFKRVQQEAEE